MTHLQSGPLAGIRILDLSTMIAAPYGATLLSDFGAEVIKVEIPNKGDTLRSMGLFKDGEPLRWPGLARNKKSLTLDLHHEEGQEILRKLVRQSDIVIENFRPNTLEKWNLGYEQLKKCNENIIMIRVSGYGQTGPYAPKAGFGTPATAFSGYTYLQGFSDRPPISPSFSLLDYITGVYVAFASCAALFHRDTEGGQGQTVDLGLYESMFRMMEFLVADYDQNGIVKERSPGLSGIPAQQELFKRKMGTGLCSPSDPTFARLAAAMNREDMLKDDRYYTNAVRLQRFEETNGIVADWVKSWDRDELLVHLDHHGVPISAINSIEDIFNDPHFNERNNIIEMKHPRLGAIKMPGVVPKFSATPGSVTNVGPDLGAHNEEILSSMIGLDEHRIQQLKNQGVI
ncbi:LOW QUALITY PROTEIN: L-carnitine dehydratase/bile acid-inducible protein F [Geomicrobium sp. JCM 19037]|nr:LOW QUALITY PROTEIN: L-carnitine dehydratase/bile acid-inducible protein F [Geomicrobium sp. JCM 19037]